MRRPIQQLTTVVMTKLKLAHHPSLDEVELRMASPPFCERKREKG